MSSQSPQHTPTPEPPPSPVTALADPRAITILTTEHWSLLSARSLAYNEAFTRGGMFLSFLSMSFVALALVSQAMSFGEQFLTIAAIVLTFDFVIGLTTYGRIMGANVDDLRTVHGMARIRHGYIEIAPIVRRYFTPASPTHDDIASLVGVYGASSQSAVGDFVYALTTSGGMIALITAMVGGVLVGVISLMLGASGELATWIGLGGAVLAFVVITISTFGRVPREQARLGVLFPPTEEQTTD